MEKYKNPILRGFHPDPSICRNGDDFYLVTSTFEYFPGVPLYHSHNLVNWNLTGHCLTRASQLPLESCGPSGGIYAPAIRCHDGIFYMTSTNVTSIRNFIVHTKDPSLGWSEPVLVDQTGIDPSLFFDDDGTVYYTSTAVDAMSQNCIQMCVIDPISGQKLSDSKIISHGCGGCYPEGPHIYKRGKYYYLLLAEGGTEYGHHATILRSLNPWGPYEQRPDNPFISHQALLGRSPIQAVGHGDLVEDQNGNWWMVCLGIRPVSFALLHNLGRETFLAPVFWSSDDWPYIGGNGRLELEMEGPLPQKALPADEAFTDDFDTCQLNPRWTFLRNPDKSMFTLQPQKGLCLSGKHSLSEPLCSPGFMGIRQEEYFMEAVTEIQGDLQEGQLAGLTAFYSNSYHYEIYLQKEAGEYFIGVNKRIHDMEKEVFREKYDYQGKIQFQIVCDETYYHFYYPEKGGLKKAASGLLAGLCTEGTARMTFTGTFIGLFSTGGTACFRFFHMKNKMR